jgi:hypothetical protein
MFRKDLIDLLLGNPMSITQISRNVGESPGQVVDDLRISCEVPSIRSTGR